MYIFHDIYIFSLDIHIFLLTSGWHIHKYILKAQCILLSLIKLICVPVSGSIDRSRYNGTILLSPCHIVKQGFKYTKRFYAIVKKRYSVLWYWLRVFFVLFCFHRAGGQKRNIYIHADFIEAPLVSFWGTTQQTKNTN